MRVILLAVKISRFYAHMQWYVLSCYTVLVVLTSGQLIANQIWEFCYSYDNYELHKALIIITCQAMTNLATWGCQAKALMGEFSLQSIEYTQHRDIWIIKNKTGVKNSNTLEYMIKAKRHFYYCFFVSWPKKCDLYFRLAVKNVIMM